MLSDSELTDLAVKSRALPSADAFADDAAQPSTGDDEDADVDEDTEGGGGGGGGGGRRALVTEVLLSAFSERESQVEAISGMPLYPDEKLLWGDALTDDNGGGDGGDDDDDENVDGDDGDGGGGGGGLTAMVPGNGGGVRADRPLALPKLSLQFLTFHDYLLRAFQLFRLEAAYEIRQDVGDAVSRLAPRSDPFGKVSARTGPGSLGALALCSSATGLGHPLPRRGLALGAYNLSQVPALA